MTTTNKNQTAIEVLENLQNIITFEINRLSDRDYGLLEIHLSEIKALMGKKIDRLIVAGKE